jgi:hypothetical protein
LAVLSARWQTLSVLGKEFSWNTGAYGVRRNRGIAGRSTANEK